MIRKFAILLLGFAASASAASTKFETFYVIPGAIPMDKGPDGNTIIFDAPKGLVVFDAGRPPVGLAGRKAHLAHSPVRGFDLHQRIGQHHDEIGPAVRVPSGRRARRKIPARDARCRIILLHGRDGGLIAFERHGSSGFWLGYGALAFRAWYISTQ